MAWEVMVPTFAAVLAATLVASAIICLCKAVLNSGEDDYEDE